MSEESLAKNGVNDDIATDDIFDLGDDGQDNLDEDMGVNESDLDEQSEESEHDGGIAPPSRTSASKKPDKITLGRQQKTSRGDAENLLKMFIHADRNKLESMVSEVEAENERTRILVEKKAKTSVKAKADIDEEEPPTPGENGDEALDEEGEEVDDELNLDVGFIPERSVTKAGDEIALQSGNFKAISDSDFIKAPSAMRALRQLFRFTPTYRILEDYDIKESCTPMARVGFIPLRGSISFMRDGDIPIANTSITETPSAAFTGMGDREATVKNFIDQNNGVELKGFSIKDGMFRKSTFNSVKILVTDTHTYLLINSLYMPGDGDSHRKSAISAYQQDSATYIYYPYDKMSNANLSPVDPENPNTEMLIAFNGGRELLRQFILGENGGLLTKSETEARVDEMLSHINQDNIKDLIGKKRHSEKEGGGTYNRNAEKENEKFINSITSNSATIVNNDAEYAEKRSASEARESIRHIIGLMRSNSLSIDLSGGKMTISSKVTPAIESLCQMHPSIKTDMSITFDSNRPDMVTSITDCVVSIPGYARMQTTDSEHILEAKKLVVSDLQSNVEAIAANLLTIAYAKRNLDVIRGAVEEHGAYASIKRSKQTYVVSRSEESQVDEIKAIVSNSSMLIINACQSLKAKLKIPEINPERAIQSCPMTILLESVLLKEAVAFVTEKVENECSVITNNEDGDNHVFVDEIMDGLEKCDSYEKFIARSNAPINEINALLPEDATIAVPAGMIVEM